MSADGRVSKEILRKLSQDVISHEWQFFIRCLFSTDDQLEESKIQAAIINNPGQVREQIYQLLLLWWDKPDATLENIIRALDEHNRPDLVVKYQGFKKSTTINEQQPSQSAIHDRVAELGQQMQGVKLNTTGLSEQWGQRSMSGSHGKEILATVKCMQAEQTRVLAVIEKQAQVPNHEKPVNQALFIPTKKPVHASHPPPPIGKKLHKPAEPPKPADTSHTTRTTEEEKHKPPDEKPVNQALFIPTKKPVHASHPPPPIGKKLHKPAEPPKPADTSHTTKTTEEEKHKPPAAKQLTATSATVEQIQQSSFDSGACGDGSIIPVIRGLNDTGRNRRRVRPSQNQPINVGGKRNKCNV